jgi:hypothetical protein
MQEPYLPCRTALAGADQTSRLTTTDPTCDALKAISRRNDARSPCLRCRRRGVFRLVARRRFIPFSRMTADRAHRPVGTARRRNLFTIAAGFPATLAVAVCSICAIGIHRRCESGAGVFFDRCSSERSFKTGRRRGVWAVGARHRWRTLNRVRSTSVPVPPASRAAGATRAGVVDTSFVPRARSWRPVGGRRG